MDAIYYSKNGDFGEGNGASGDNGRYIDLLNINIQAQDDAVERSKSAVLNNTMNQTNNMKLVFRKHLSPIKESPMSGCLVKDYGDDMADENLRR